MSPLQILVDLARELIHQQKASSMCVLLPKTEMRMRVATETLRLGGLLLGIHRRLAR